MRGWSGSFESSAAALGGRSWSQWVGLGVLLLLSMVVVASPLVASAPDGEALAVRASYQGRALDEVQIRLDGQEIYDAYHLQDYDSAMSVVAPEGLDSRS